MRRQGSVDERWNNEFGLTCRGKPARYVCPGDGKPSCFKRFLVPVDEVGVPLAEEFRASRLCGEGALYGCTDQEGREVVPFVHSYPIEFTASGFALVKEEYPPEQRECCGNLYVDARYEQRLQALTIDGIPEPWLPLNVVRYRKDGKIGFLDLRSGMVTPPKFESAYSFYDADGEPRRKTLVCVGCHPQRWAMCAPPEAHCTGEAFLIDEQGKRLKEEPDETYVEYWWCKKNPGKHFEPEPEGFCE